MKMDAQFIINTLGALFIAIVGWVARQLWDAVQRLKEDVKKIEVNLPTNYVSKSDFDKTMRHIEDMFQRIYDKLDGKADK